MERRGGRDGSQTIHDHLLDGRCGRLKIRHFGSEGEKECLGDREFRRRHRQFDDVGVREVTSLECRLETAPAADAAEGFGERPGTRSRLCEHAGVEKLLQRRDILPVDGAFRLLALDQIRQRQK